jgi:hypothetical protein
MDGVFGDTAIEVKVNGELLTVSSVLPLVLPIVAVIVAVPAATHWAMPVELMVATDVADELQVTLAVMSFVVLSLRCPVAVNCCDVPALMVGVGGPTLIDCNVAGVWFPPPPELPPPHPTSNATQSSVVIAKTFFILAPLFLLRNPKWKYAP